MEELIGTLRDDMKELKDAFNELKNVVVSIKERIISNEKDLETVIREYARTGAQVEDLKKYVNEQDQHIWNEIRSCQANCKEHRKICAEAYARTVNEAKADVKKDVKLWLVMAILSAIGAVVFSVVSKVAQEVIK